MDATALSIRVGGGFGKTSMQRQLLQVRIVVTEASQLRMNPRAAVGGGGSMEGIVNGPDFLFPGGDRPFVYADPGIFIGVPWAVNNNKDSACVSGRSINPAAERVVGGCSSRFRPPAPIHAGRPIHAPVPKIVRCGGDLIFWLARYVRDPVPGGPRRVLPFPGGRESFMGPNSLSWASDGVLALLSPYDTVAVLDCFLLLGTITSRILTAGRNSVFFRHSNFPITPNLAPS
ncbi:hypothetical protein GWI33_011265 [Rhynchophorus ferrugineus]|uniref:Uncharacterized protein n=1 Tax=Rhynchophorus ferrugineus TaxID=354439 RepID=A0A834IBW8_RHYFE|nr:hypothetical protein GWI33_011265 [Rhynchophorus ferrugineus]